MEVSAFYGGRHPSEVPFYTQRDVASACNVPRSTLRGWLASTVEGENTNALICGPEGEGGRLSFLNLVEAYVISELRSQMGVSLPRLRNTVMYHRQQGIERPFLNTEHWLVGSGVYLPDEDDLIDVSDWGQYVIRPIIDGYISRIQFTGGKPITLYPAFGDRESDRVAIDPRVRFGHPVIRDTGVRTSTVWERVRSGEAVEEIAWGYDLGTELVADALRYEATRRVR